MERMTTFYLNGGRMHSREDAHAYLKRALRLPEWYGENLDALYDCLGEIGKPTRIVLFRQSAMLAQLGGYGERLIHTFCDAAQENGNLQFEAREHRFHSPFRAMR